jgi:multidrug resistance protein, MATE family
VIWTDATREQGTSSFFPRLIRLSWPLALAHTSNILIATTDVALNGRFGSGALATSALAFSVFIVFLIFGAGFYSVSGPQFVQCSTSEDCEGRRALWQSCWLLSAVVAVPLSALMVWGPGLAAHLGVPTPLPAASRLYLSVLAISLWPELIFLFTWEFAAANGRQATIMYIAAGSVVVNFLFDLLFMYGLLFIPAFGVVGSALGTLATAITKATALLLLIRARIPKRSGNVLAAFPRLIAQKTLRLLKIGLPAAFTETITIAFFSCTTFIVASLGNQQLAGHAITLQLTEVAIVAALGIGEAAALTVAEIAGPDGTIQELRRCAYSALALGITVFLVFSALFIGFGSSLSSLFLAKADPAESLTRELTQKLLLIGALFVPVDGAQIIMVGLLRGIGDTRVPMYLCTVAYWVIGIPCCYVLGSVYGYGAQGVWYGLSIGLAIAAILLFLRYQVSARRVTHV